MHYNKLTQQGHIWPRLCKNFMLMKKKPAVEAEYLNCQEILQWKKWPEGAV